MKLQFIVLASLDSFLIGIHFAHIPYLVTSLTVYRCKSFEIILIVKKHLGQN